MKHIVHSSTRRLGLGVELAAIPLSLYRKYAKGLKLDNPNLYSDIFKKYGSGRNNNHRIYIPLGSSKPLSDTTKVNPEVLEYLAARDFTIDNYLVGTAIMPDGKRTIKIGKILSKEPKLKSLFDADPSRRAASAMGDGKLLVVVSRHPYDILGSSFDRGWTSCTNLKGGGNATQLRDSIKYGLLVAYLVRDEKDDPNVKAGKTINTGRNINKPLARILIRPYFNDNDEVLLSVDSTEYGTAPAAFGKIVNTFVNWANSDVAKGHYKSPMDMYLDKAPYRIGHNLTASDVTDAKDVQWITSESELVALSKSKSKNANILAAVMKHPKTPAAVLVSGAKNADPKVSNRALENPNIPAATLILKFKSNSAEVRVVVLKNPNVPIEILLIGAKDTDEDVREAVMSHKKATPEILMLGAKDKIFSVAREAADNSNATPEVLILMAAHKNSDVRLAVMEHSNATPDILMIGAGDKDEEVRNAVTENTNVTTEILLKLATHKLPETREAAMRSTKATPEVLMLSRKDKSEYVRAEAAKNPNAPIELLRLGMKDEYPVMYAALNNKAAPLDFLMEVTEHRDPHVRYVLMGSSNATTEILLRGLEDDPDICSAAIQNPKATIEVIMKAYESDSRHIRKYAMAHENATPAILLVGAKDGEGMVRLAVAQNEATSISALRILAQDTSPRVRGYVARNPNATDDIIKMVRLARH